MRLGRKGIPDSHRETTEGCTCFNVGYALNPRPYVQLLHRINDPLFQAINNLETP